jgi:hypothetical protein
MSDIVTDPETPLRRIVTNRMASIDPKQFAKAMATAPVQSVLKTANGTVRKEKFRFTEPKTFEPEQLNGMLYALRVLYGEHGSNPPIRRQLSKLYAILKAE